MDPETQAKLIALLKKTAADVVADWKWPLWRRDDEQNGGSEQNPGRGA
jgi:hypothetical protein